MPARGFRRARGLRYCCLVEGEEHTGRFFFEGSRYADYDSFLDQKPARVSIDAVELAWLGLLARADLYRLYEERPVFERFGRPMAERAYRGSRARRAVLLHQTPTKRYAQLVRDRSELVQRVPQRLLEQFRGWCTGFASTGRLYLVYINPGTALATDTRAKLAQALGGSAKPGTGNNILAGFCVAPELWRGLGVGARISGSFGAPVAGDFGDDHIFNYHHLALAAKYYVLSREFGRGLHVRGSAGFGQLTTKRFNEEANFYRHQYALGTSLIGGLGYMLSLQRLKPRSGNRV